MKIAVLFSGGKDSVYATWLSMLQGFDIAVLISLKPENPESYMFHHPNIELTKLQAQAAGFKHKLVKTKGGKEEELADLKRALKGLGIDGVVSGAIESEYQKERVERICWELGLRSFAPLWRKNQETIAHEEAQALEAIIVSVSAEGLGREWLGRHYDPACVSDLIKLNRRFGISICGEGGEFETLVLNAPFFKKRLHLDDCAIEWKGSSGVLSVKKASLIAIH